MLKKVEKTAEITAKKDVVLDVRCENCGKKLCEIGKKSAKTADFLLKIKCTRCSALNSYNLK